MELLSELRFSDTTDTSKRVKGYSLLVLQSVQLPITVTRWETQKSNYIWSCSQRFSCKCSKLYAYTWKCFERRNIDNTRSFLKKTERSNIFSLPMSRLLGLGLHCLYPWQLRSSINCMCSWFKMPRSTVCTVFVSCGQSGQDNGRGHVTGYPVSNRSQQTKAYCLTW